MVRELGRIRILFVESGTFGGGSFQSLLQLLRSMDRERFEPRVAFLNRTVFVEKVREMGIPVHLVWDAAYSRRGLPGTLRRKAESLVEHAFERLPRRAAERRTALVHAPLIRSLSRLVEWHGIDVLYCNNQINRDIFGVFVSRRTGVPMVSHLRSPHGDSFVRSKVDFANETVAAYISNSDETRRYWEGRGIDPATNCVVRNGMPAFEVEPLDLEAGFGIGPGSFTVTCVSRLLPIKGQDFLVEAFAVLRERASNARLLLVGEGEFRPELEAQVRRLGLSQAVVFAGFDERARQIMAASDVLVQPSKFDSFGRTIGEAMRIGTPVVATDVGGIREIVRPGENGLLVTDGDTKGLADALMRIAGEKGLAKRLAEAAAETVQNMLDLDARTREIERVVERVVRSERVDVQGPSE